LNLLDGTRIACRFPCASLETLRRPTDGRSPGGPREAEEVPMESLTDSAYVSGHRHRRRHQRVPRRNIVLLALLGIIFLVGIASAVGLIVGYSLHVF
jgi:hypothetical protein